MDDFPALQSDADRITVRPARPEEAAQITALAMRSKGHWGYDAEFLQACREDLTIDPAWCDGTKLLVAWRGFPAARRSRCLVAVT